MSRFLQAVMKFITEYKLEEHYEFHTYIFEKFLSEQQKFNSLDMAKTSLLDHPDAHRILKGLIVSVDGADQKFKDSIGKSIKKLYDSIKDHLDVLV